MDAAVISQMERIEESAMNISSYKKYQLDHSTSKKLHDRRYLCCLISSDMILYPVIVVHIQAIFLILEKFDENDFDFRHCSRS